MMVTISRVMNKGKTEDFFRIKLYSYLKYFAEYYAINSHALQLSWILHVKTNYTTGKGDFVQDISQKV